MRLATHSCSSTLSHRPRAPTGAVVTSAHAHSVPLQAARLLCRNRRCAGAPSGKVVCHASSGSSEDGGAASASMSTDDAARILGLPSGATASFDDILARKNALLDAAGSDKQKCEEVERAYDTLFMQSMRRRLSGDVSTSVRFADVSAPRKASSSRGVQGGGSGGSPKLPSLGGSNPLSSLGLTLAVPRNQQLATQQAAVFSALALWALIQACVEDPAVQLGDTAGTQLTLALAYSVYTLKENKKLDWGKSIGLSFAGLIVFALLGTAVQNWLRVDIVPLGSFQSPGVFCTEFVITGLMLFALFLA